MKLVPTVSQLLAASAKSEKFSPAPAHAVARFAGPPGAEYVQTEPATLSQALLLGRPKRKRRLRLFSSRADLFSCEIAARAVATPACTPGQGVHGAASARDCVCERAE